MLWDKMYKSIRGSINSDPIDRNYSGLTMILFVLGRCLGIKLITKSL